MWRSNALFGFPQIQRMERPTWASRSKISSSFFCILFFNNAAFGMSFCESLLLQFSFLSFASILFWGRNRALLPIKSMCIWPQSLSLPLFHVYLSASASSQTFLLSSIIPPKPICACSFPASLFPFSLSIDSIYLSSLQVQGRLEPGTCWDDS